MDEHETWREYAKAVAGGIAAAIPSAIGTAQAVGPITHDDWWWQVPVIIGAALVGGLTGAITVYAVPNRRPSPTTTQRVDPNA